MAGMKKLKKVITTVLAAAFLVSVFGSSAMAAAETYTYTVTFFAGEQGTFADTSGLSVTGRKATVSQTEDKIVISGLEASDVVSFNAQASIVLDEDSRHYVKGVRLSGRDNDTVSSSVFTVTSDEDYVVAYGIKGNQTSYTINYQDTSGNTLSASDTYYGKVGDKPVVAYKYMEGYHPQVLGYTKTLSENTAENVFTFVYERSVEEIVVETVVGSGTSESTAASAPTSSPTSASTSVSVPASAQTQPSATGNDGTEENLTDAEEVQGETTEDTMSPETELEQSQIVDLDEEEVPLAKPELNQKNKVGALGVGLVVAMASAVVVLAGVMLYVMRQKTK